MGCRNDTKVRQLNDYDDGDYTFTPNFTLAATVPPYQIQF